MMPWPGRSLRATPDRRFASLRPRGAGLLVAAARRFLVLLASAAGVTAAASLVLAAALGASVERAVSLGFYIVGSFLLVAGFFVGNRGPIRLRNEQVGVPLLGSRFVRWATPDEREQTLSDSAILVSLGFALVLLGVALDSRTSVF